MTLGQCLDSSGPFDPEPNLLTAIKFCHSTTQTLVPWFQVCPFNSTPAVSLTNLKDKTYCFPHRLREGRPLAFLRTALVKISLTLHIMKLCYALAWPFYSRIWNFYVYFYTLLGAPNWQIPNKNIFNNRKWKNEGCTDIGVMRPAPSLEMSLVNVPTRDPAANVERRIIHHTRSSSVFRVQGLHLHSTFLGNISYHTKQLRSESSTQEHLPMMLARKVLAASPLGEGCLKHLLPQRSLEHQGSVFPLRTSGMMFRLPGREKILEFLYTSPHLQRRIHQISQWPLPASPACGHHLMGRAHTSTGVPTCITFQQASMYPHTRVYPHDVPTHISVFTSLNVSTPLSVSTYNNESTCLHVATCVNVTHTYQCNPHPSMYPQASMYPHTSMYPPASM